MKAALLTVGSLALSAGVIANAYIQKKQFYPSVVYITKSNPSMAVLYIQAFVMVILMGKLMRKIFFGQLRAAEMEHLIERSWYAVTETCLAFTVFREEFSPRFVGLFTLLLFLKCFHWLAEDRVDYMERSPVISVTFHIRVISLLAFLGLLDVYFINHAYYSTLLKGASVQLVFGFEYAILFTMVLTVLVKYILHTIDLQSDNPWLNKAVYMLYTDLVLGFVKVALYMLFLAIMIKVHTFPLFAIRPMYLTMRSFKKALNDVIMSRRAIRNMNTLYADATEEELQSGDNVCIICREVMSVGSKKLPCNHIFHTSCLRSWFLRQQTCPTCRMDVLRPATRRTPPPQPPHQPQQANQAPNAFFAGMPGVFPGAMWPPHQAPAHQPDAPANGATPPTSAPASSTAETHPASADGVGAAGHFAFPGSGASMPPFMMMPPFGMMPPFYLPPPMPPADFAGLSESELNAMEGTERQNVEARIQCLRHIQTLLDAAVLQMQQYTNLMNTYGLNTTPGRSDVTTPSTTLPSTCVAAVSTVQSGATSVPSSSASVTSASLTSTVTTSSASTPIPSPSAQPVSQSTSPSASTLPGDSLDLSELEGAVGFTPPKEELIPKWTADAGEDDSSSEEVREMRKRRLQKFSQNSEMKQNDNLDL